MTKKMKQEIKKKLKILLKVLANILKKKEFHGAIIITIITMIDYYILKMFWESCKQMLRLPLPIPAKFFFTTGFALVMAIFGFTGAFLVGKIAINMLKENN